MPAKKGGKKNIREDFINDQLTKEKKLSLWFWVGVIGLGTMIAVFWGYSIWSNMSSFNWKKTEENKILNKTNTDWDELFQTDKENSLKNELTKLQIKELISQALKQQIKKLPATSTTATIDMTTSTIISTTINTSSNR